MNSDRQSTVLTPYFSRASANAAFGIETHAYLTWCPRLDMRLSASHLCTTDDKCVSASHRQHIERPYDLASYLVSFIRRKDHLRPRYTTPIMDEICSFTLSTTSELSTGRIWLLHSRIQACDSLALPAGCVIYQVQIGYIRCDRTFKFTNKMAGRSTLLHFLH